MHLCLWFNKPLKSAKALCSLSCQTGCSVSWALENNRVVEGRAYLNLQIQILPGVKRKFPHALVFPRVSSLPFPSVWTESHSSHLSSPSVPKEFTNIRGISAPLQCSHVIIIIKEINAYNRIVDSRYPRESVAQEIYTEKHRR